MNFNNPLPRSVQPKFHEGSQMRSVRDSDANARAWSRNRTSQQQNNSYGNAIHKIQRQIEGLKRRIVGGFVPQPVSTLGFHPFRIYKPQGFSSATGITFLGDDGTPTECNIDATVPTDFTAVPPTVNPNTDAWRFWTVRSGFVEYRPIYNYANVIHNIPVNPSYNNSSLGVDPENFVWKWIMNDADSVTDQVVPFDDPSSVLFGGVKPIIINGDLNTNFVYALWVSFVQETTVGPATFKIQACRSNNAFGSTTISAFPSTSFFSIPIGIITFFEGVPTITQYAFDHIRGRYPNAVQGMQPVNNVQAQPSFGTVMNYRGNWDIDSGLFQPFDLTDQVFYAGDVVRVYTTVLGSGSNYQYVDTRPWTWEDPQSSARWIQIS